MHRVQRVMLELVAARSLTWTAVMGKLAVGIPLCLFGPLLVTCLAKGIELKWQANLFPEFLLMMFLVALFLVPLLMLYERRTRGEFLSDALLGTDTSRPSSRGEWEMRGTKALWAFYVDAALLGPRLLWSAIAFLRKRAPIDTKVHLVAANLVVELLDHGTAFNVRELVGPARSASDILSAVRLLKECDWIDMSRRRDRVWLCSPIRNRLANL